MAQDIRWQQRFNNFNRSLKQLTAAVDLHVQREFTELEKQGVIQGFEIVHELAWNVLKDLLEFEGIQGIVGSRGAVREAFKRGILEDGELWFTARVPRALIDRALTSISRSLAPI